MGYNTDFEGKFTLTPALTRAQEREITELVGDDPEDGPDSYCGWEVTDDGASLEWDGGEKFDLYLEWLQYIIDKLSPMGVAVSGSVSYQGEDPTDFGQIEAQGGKATRKPGKRQSFEELLKEAEAKLKPRGYSNDNYDVTIMGDAVRVVPKGDTRKALIVGMMLMEGITLQDKSGYGGVRVEVTYTKDGEPKGLRIDQI